MALQQIPFDSVKNGALYSLLDRHGAIIITGVDNSPVERLHAEIKKFFDVPPDEKNKLRNPSPGYYTGNPEYPAFGEHLCFSPYKNHPDQLSFLEQLRHSYPLLVESLFDTFDLGFSIVPDVVGDFGLPDGRVEILQFWSRNFHVSRYAHDLGKKYKIHPHPDLTTLLSFPCVGEPLRVKIGDKWHSHKLGWDQVLSVN